MFYIDDKKPKPRVRLRLEWHTGQIRLLAAAEADLDDEYVLFSFREDGTVVRWGGVDVAGLAVDSDGRVEYEDD